MMWDIIGERLLLGGDSISLALEMIEIKVKTAVWADVGNVKRSLYVYGKAWFLLSPFQPYKDL